MQLGTQKTKIKLELARVRADLMWGDYKAIAKTTGLTKTDISRVFDGKLMNSEKSIHVLNAAKKIISQREKMIA